LEAVVHDRKPITEGLQVVGDDMRPVGLVAVVRDQDFLIDGPVLPDIRVPYDAVRDVADDLVVLAAQADDVDYLPGVTAADDSPSRAGIRTGMEVEGVDQEQIGWVKARYPDALLVARSLERDIYVPYDAIQAVTTGSVALNVPAGEVDYQGWAYPPPSES
jgi:sporulation protein YlmC with PRC-barrel domain